MSLQFNLNNSAASTIASAPVAIDLGVTEKFNTIEVRATVARASANRANTLFTFQGGSVMRSKKGDNFTSFMLRPFVYKGEKGSRLMQFNSDGSIQYDDLWVRAVRRQEVSSDVANIIALCEAVPANKDMLLMMATEAQRTAVVNYFAAGGSLESKELNLENFQNNILRHQNIKYKANIPDKFIRTLERIKDKLSEEKKYSIVMRFSTSDIYVASELKEAQREVVGGEKEAVTYPNGNIVYLKEVTVRLTHLDVIEGATWSRKTENYLDPEIATNAVEEAINAASSQGKPKYFSMEKLQEEANKVNAWAQKIESTTNNKYLKKLGYTGKDCVFDQLAVAVTQGDTEATKQFEEMKQGLLEAAASGNKEDLTIERANKIIESAISNASKPEEVPSTTEAAAAASQVNSDSDDGEVLSIDEMKELADWSGTFA